MHDLIQQMGWEIVRKDHISDPGMHSRLWRDRDALRVLQENMGTRVVQGIFLTSPRDHEEILSDPFENMKSLRLLKICNVKFSESHEYYLSRELRLLEWHGYPLKSIMSSFQLDRLVELSMPHSRLEQLWKKTMHLEELMLINLSNCQYLIETPDFDFVPNLERLVLEDCKRLSKLHPSIAEHKHLALLNLKGCENLEELPQRISLKCLSTFFLSGCSNLKEFPEIVGDMRKLSILHIDGTGIRELPTSINLLTGLIGLNMANCRNLLSLRSGILSGLTSLKGLNLSGCVSMDQLPEDLGSLENLEHLFADGTPTRKLPSSIVLLKCLKVLSLHGCGLVQLPDDIGRLSLLQYLNLIENNFSSIPESISQLSELKNLYLSKCSMLESLPKHFPVNLRYVNARDCPMLTDCSKTEMTILTSNKGFQFIDCRNSSSVDEDSTIGTPLPMPTEHVDLLLPKFFKGLVNDGKQFEIRFPCTTIPLWCTNWNTMSPIKIELSSEDREDTGRITMGFALFVVFVMKELEHGNFDGELELKKIFCHFYINKRPLEKTLDFANFKHFRLGSFGVCSYVPVEWFGEQLSTSSRVIEASFSRDRLDVELRMFGMHQVFNHEVEGFSDKLAQNANDHLDLEMNFDRHCQKLLEGANELAASGNITAVKHEGESSSGVPQNEAEQDHTVWDSVPSIEYKNFINETYSLLSVVFQGSFARHNCFYLLLPFPILSPWFFHHSVGNVAVCYLPPNIYEDERWLGLELYVKCELRRSRTVGDSTSEIVDLNIDLYAHGKSMSPILCHKIKIPVHSRFVTIHVPRKYFSEELNNYEGLSVIFKPTTPDVEVKMCGTRLLYEQESKLISKGIIQCIFQIPSLLQVVHEAAIGLLQSDQSDNDESNIALQREMPQSSRMPTYEPRERNIIKSSQKFLTSTEQLAMEVSTSIDKYRREYAERRVFDNTDPVLFHSKQSFLKNWESMQEEDTPCKLSGTFNHLHIMAESILPVSDSQNLIETLKILLREFFKHRVLVTLSLKGHIVFALKHFVPSSPYNLCFPQKGIPKWFDDHQLNNSMVAIALPPNLSHDKSWKGLVICASFSVNENPDAFSKGSFRVLCHLASEGICLNPVALCSVTKDKIKWLYVRGFIWLAYIPNVMLAELNGKNSVEARIYSQYPGLIVDKCGIRLLYEKDVEQLKQTIIQCCTSFVEDWDLMDKFVANEDYE
ncbi:uncharacterized protein LOC21392707 [Morus notabilis]|uniref:uncharacterized protein LOC21392707 n=1 Tax=Morus notabilis TaxID=981085 RepID=UPI000CED0F1C|nr:uncharacterized protein LOC21392707 [Morus notabilis]